MEGKKVILTVDDSRTIRDMLKACLTQAGFEVCQAIDGMDGLTALEDTIPDVIITDINMPRLDGFGFIKEVRNDQRLRSTPILVLTTDMDVEKKSRAREAGATGWIVKPFDADKLISAIRRVSQ